MALLTKVRIFGVGREVWVCTCSNHTWVPVQGYVFKVTKGCIHVRYDGYKRKEFSPNSRMLNLTKEECNAICTLLNDSLFEE